MSVSRSSTADSKVMMRRITRRRLKNATDPSIKVCRGWDGITNSSVISPE